MGVIDTDYKEQESPAPINTVPVIIQDPLPVNSELIDYTTNSLPLPDLAQVNSLIAIDLLKAMQKEIKDLTFRVEMLEIKMIGK